MSSSRNVRKIVHIKSLRFNQDSSCFICATCDGIRVFNVDPLSQKCFINVGSAAYAEMFYHTNLIAYVPADHATDLASNAVNIYDDQIKQHVLQLSFHTPVASIRMLQTKSNYRLLVILVNEIHIFSFPNNCQHLRTIDTRENPKGLCEVTSNSNGLLMAFPYNSRSKGGYVQLLTLDDLNNEINSKPRIIHAHDNELAAMALNSSGSLLATASKRGTLVRIYLTTGELGKIFEFRRGSDIADIYSLSFSFDSGFLCVSSDTGTVHLFGIRNPQSNRTGLIQDILSETFCDLCNFKVDSESPCICTFSDANHIVAASFNGTYNKYIFTGGGRCNREEYELYLDGMDGCDF